jgi:hypothetical protein
MISPAVVAAALAFWTPYNGGEPLPCTAANVHVDKSTIGETSYELGWANLGPGNCDVNIAPAAVETIWPSVQCTILAHEWGHAWFGLGHSDDPKNVMYASFDLVPIRACASLDDSLPRAKVESVTVKFPRHAKKHRKAKR